MAVKLKNRWLIKQVGRQRQRREGQGLKTRPAPKTFTYYTAIPRAHTSCVSSGRRSRWKRGKSFCTCSWGSRTPIRWNTAPLGCPTCSKKTSEHLLVIGAFLRWMYYARLIIWWSKMIDSHCWWRRSRIHRSKSKMDCVRRDRTSSPHPSACQSLKLKIGKYLCWSIGKIFWFVDQQSLIKSKVSIVSKVTR